MLPVTVKLLPNEADPVKLNNPPTYKFFVIICPPDTLNEAAEFSEVASVVPENVTRLATFNVLPIQTDLLTPRPPSVCKLPVVVLVASFVPMTLF